MTAETVSDADVSRAYDAFLEASEVVAMDEVQAKTADDEYRGIRAALKVDRAIHATEVERLRAEVATMREAFDEVMRFVDCCVAPGTESPSDYHENIVKEAKRARDALVAAGAWKPDADGCGTWTTLTPGADMTAETKPLHVFGDDCEWVIAHDLEDAQRVYEEHVGAPVPDQAERWDQESDDKRISVLMDPHEAIVLERGNPVGHEVERTCAEWAARLGRGYFCTTEG